MEAGMHKPNRLGGAWKLDLRHRRGWAGHGGWTSFVVEGVLAWLIDFDSSFIALSYEVVYRAGHVHGCCATQLYISIEPGWNLRFGAWKIYLQCFGLLGAARALM